MKRKNVLNRILLFTFALITLIGSDVSIGDRLIKVSGDRDYPPYEFLDSSGNYRGFNIDLMNAISIELGFEVEYQPSSWNNALKSVENGKADLIQGISRSEDREEKLIFSHETLSNSQSIFVRKEDTVIFGVDDLKGKKVAIQSGDISRELLKEISAKDIELEEYENQEQAMRALKSGKVDAFVGNRLTGLYYIQSRNLFDDIKIAEDISGATSYSIAGRKGNEKLIGEINKALKTIKSNGTYDKIYRKWFGESIENSGGWKYIALAALAAFVLITMTVSLVNRKLKYEVNLRTRQLNEENNLRENIIANVEIGIAAFSSSGNVIACNELISDILNQKIENGISYKDIDIVKDLSSEEISGEKFSRDIEIGNPVKKFIVYSIIPLKYGDKKNGFILSVSDLTKERKTNEILSQNDKMKSLGVLSASIAHEVRNPLTSIKMFVDMLPDRKNDDKFFSKFMDIVPKELKRLDSLTYSLLDYSKQQKPSPKDIMIKSVLGEVMILIKPYMKKKSINIVEDIEDIEIYIDPYQLKQIVLNILMNSVDSIENQGEIVLSAHRTEEFVEINIKDSGAGIDSESLDKIYELFYTSKAHGTGMGLSIVRKLVLENNGTIDIKSEKGEGTEVSIKFF